MMEHERITRLTNLLINTIERVLEGSISVEEANKIVLLSKELITLDGMAATITAQVKMIVLPDELDGYVPK